jgi:membrane protease YdiL (CAAX protease family)
MVTANRINHHWGLVTLLFGIAKLDLNFTMIREALTSAASGNSVPAKKVVAIQVLFALTLAPFINMLFALGEELGWRGFLLPHLMPLGQWKAILTWLYLNTRVHGHPRWHMVRSM